MTHSLHREGPPQHFQEDFVVSIVPSTGRNVIGAGEKIKQFYRMMLKHNPTNFGIKRVGQMYQAPSEEIIEKIPGRTHSHTCVLINQDDLVEFMKDIKQADLGISVVATGLYPIIKECCDRADIKPHTVNLSLGIWGKTEKLPPPEIREITTMCGHGMVSPHLIESMARRVKDGTLTPRDAAIEIARPCYCGIVNVHTLTSQIQEIAARL
jgi:hypothetical protein